MTVHATQIQDAQSGPQIITLESLIEMERSSETLLQHKGWHIKNGGVLLTAPPHPLRVCH